MVKVCDAIMGSGKTESAITYINEHSGERFIYITPYLDEAKRIRESCPSACFIEPSDRLPEFHFRKTEHAMDLIRRGCNIATTHQAFKLYDQETLDNIKKIGYTLIIDENVDILEQFDCNAEDIDILHSAGYIKEKNDTYTATDKNYKGIVFHDFFSLMRTRELIKVCSDKKEVFYYWTLPPELITSFKDVFILTYLFKGQSICHFLNIYGIDYDFIGTSYKDGVYRFSDDGMYIPEYTKNLSDMIHILDNKKMNSIGDDFYAMSKTWYKKESSDTKQLKKNIDNYFRNIMGNVPAKFKLWGSFNDAYGTLRGKGYSNSFLVFNARATNTYKDRYTLTYPTNIFMNVGEKIFYQNHNIEVDEDLYALSVMIQWIWRSAIRDGHEIWIYIPSRRMRDMLKTWIQKVSLGVSGNV